MKGKMAVNCSTILLLTFLLTPFQVFAAEEDGSQWTITPRLWKSKYQDVSAYIPGTISTKSQTRDIDFYGRLFPFFIFDNGNF